MKQEFHDVGQVATMDGRPAPGTQAVDRAAQLLAQVLEAERPVAVGDLAAAAELPKSTVSRLLGGLIRRELLERESPRGKLVPGPVLLRYARRGARERDLVELARAPLDALAEASGETVNLGVPALAGVDHLAQVEGPHFVGTGHWVGRRVPYHCSANGKVLLAFGAAAVPPGPLAALTPDTIVDRERLEAELAGVRVHGIATAVDELEPGLASIAAPVRGEDGAVVAVISISGPGFRLSGERLRSLRASVVEQAAALSRRLGHCDDTQGAA
jgi:IclR family acetate operon transcriptional repressor